MLKQCYVKGKCIRMDLKGNPFPLIYCTLELIFPDQTDTQIRHISYKENRNDSWYTSKSNKGYKQWQFERWNCHSCKQDASKTWLKATLD